MKAFVADAEWAPRKGYLLTESEKKTKRVVTGSQVWRNPTFAVKDIPTPEPADDEVLVKVKSCGICGSDTHLYETDPEGYIIFSGLTKLPCVLGHEFSGVVEKAGKRVRNLKVGDAVAMESVMWCGTCTACRSGTPNQCNNVELLGLSALGLPGVPHDGVPAGRYDVVVECTGHPEGLELARRALRAAGTLVLKSTYHGQVAVDFSSLVVDEITLLGSRCGPFPPAIDALARGAVRVEPLIEATYALSHAMQAFEHAFRPGALKVLITP